MENHNEQTNKIKVYLDHATLPSLKYLLDFAQEKENNDSTYFFALKRVNLPEHILAQFPEGKIHYLKLMGDTGFPALEPRFQEIIDQAGEFLNIEIHSNLSYYRPLFGEVLDILNRLDRAGRLKGLALHLYDDGSDGVMALNDILQDCENIPTYMQNLNQDLNCLFDTENKFYRYAFNLLTNATYHLLPDSIRFLETEELAPLRALVKNYQPLNLNQYYQFNAEQRAFADQLFGIDETLKQEIQQHFAPDKKTFLFVGTTMFVDSFEENGILYRIHRDAIKSYLEGINYFAGIEQYQLFIKLHPSVSQLQNKDFLQDFPNIKFLPSHIPYEILQMLGCKPTKIGGFFSTLQLAIGEETERTNLIFITERNTELRDGVFIYSVQYRLMQTLKKLGYLNDKQICLYEDILQFDINEILER